MTHLRVLIYAGGELYRQFSVDLAVSGYFGYPPSEGAQVVALRRDVLRARADQLGLRAPRDWQRPLGVLQITVVDQDRAFVRGEVIEGGRTHQANTFTDWRGAQAAIAGPIDNLRRAAERFRAAEEGYLNDIDPENLRARLSSFVPQRDWSLPRDDADASHRAVWERTSRGAELRELAVNGYDLYQRIFPIGSQLRTWLDALPPGHRLDLNWMDLGTSWVPAVPWGLMYLGNPDEVIDPSAFFGLRFRIGYAKYAREAPAKHLGSPNETYRAHCLYWGTAVGDPTAAEARWQEHLWAASGQHVFVPANPAAPEPKQALLDLLRSPAPRPLPVLYLFCQSSLDRGANEPVLRFANGNQAADTLRRAELPRSPLPDRPLVFANACSTSAADPYIANELEATFFDRGSRAFLGAETKVPIQFASRFAAVFFHFFYRQVDPAPIAAGEAVAQTRLFLWTQFKNIGGLLYTYINEYELFMADEEEVSLLRM